MPDNFMLYALIALAALNLIQIVLIFVLRGAVSAQRNLLGEQSALLKSAVNGMLAADKESERRHFEVMGAMEKLLRRPVAEQAVSSPAFADSDAQDALMDMLLKLAKLDKKMDELREETAHGTTGKTDETAAFKARMFDKIVSLAESGADKQTILRSLKSER